MRSALNVMGFVLLGFGLLLGLAGKNLVLIFGGLFCCLTLLALSRIIKLVEPLHNQALHIPFTTSQLLAILHKSPAFSVDSPHFEVYPNNEIPYPLPLLDGEYYIRAKVFYSYLSQEGSAYTFSLPDARPETLHCSYSYYNGADLFSVNDQVYVRLRKLGLTPNMVGNKAVLERTAN